MYLNYFPWNSSKAVYNDSTEFWGGLLIEWLGHPMTWLGLLALAPGSFCLLTWTLRAAGVIPASEL